MTATDQTRQIIPASADTGDAAAHSALGADAAMDAASEDEQVMLRIANLPRDVGWMMISVGVLGVVLPGLPGAPFLVAGMAVLAPGGPRRLARWARRRPRGVVHTGLKQIGRWLDDMERRYPQRASTSP
jgi:hypothetical protein